MERYAISSTSAPRGNAHHDQVESIPDGVPARRIATGELPADQLESLLCSDEPFRSFNSLGYQQKQILFSYILEEVKHIREHPHHGNQCPEADRAVVLHNRERFSQEVADALLERPRIDWSYANDSFVPVDRIRWCAIDLQLEVCRPRGGCQEYTVKKRFLHEAISSHLLYYRLAVVFGMPKPGRTDGYKTCWSIVLQFRDETGRLELSDSKGGAWAKFCGSGDASTAALWLLEWIVSDQVPHNYDGVLAGCIA